MVASAGAKKPRGRVLPQQNDLRVTLPDAGDPSAERIAQLLAVAKRTFGEKGFAATTMDDIAGAAGMSKKTLYKLFDSKSDLFRAMLTHNLQRFQFGVASRSGIPVIDELREAMRFIADVVFSPDEIALHRLIVAERKQSPALAGIFTDVIFKSGDNGVVDCIKRIKLKSTLEDLPARTVAEMMIGAVFSHDHFRAMVDETHQVNRRAINKRIDAVIATFCEAA
ncbi:TetR/AcrR family transcriptional regulator [Tardiphaga alba]|uniref:TetR/AcrR family transcriptional regulator n=1 Tax=Tardiphaga alba TaxID=340268 RepID=UPI002012213E|nr:TetR/AcrR family transcriptional regulator [Tardiphaga alba]